MKLVIIRHADPDYPNNTITEKGKVEAELLAKFLKNKKMDYVYCSPMGRAQDTCKASQKECGFEFETLPWLREFGARVYSPTRHFRTLAWDQMPSFFTKRPLLYDSERWLEDTLFANNNMEEQYLWVKNGLLELLKKHGYEREDGSLIFKAVRPNRDTIVLFCHFGLLGMVLSILTGFSPYVFWQHFCAAPSSVTTLVTEEREDGKAIFRCSSYGDISHLNMGGEPPAFAARFCETFDCEDERH